jgi:hypothetical protein
MSILKSKHNGWLSDGTRTPFTGGGGGGPSQTTTQTSNIPEYARPYVENMLGATQNQLFTTSGGTPGTDATYDAEGNMLTPAVAGSPREITGFKPYQAYSQNVNDYFAGFSPMQQQSFGGMGNMQPASQLATATDMAGIAGLGSLGAGAQFARQATDPSAVQQYMSPYMQNVVDYQKQSAVRDYGMAMPKLQAQAVGQNAFGGNRMALQQAEAQRGLMSQLQGIQATGTQKAFEDAQRQQQFGANLGLQGFGQALQGAGQLGQLGQTQYGQQMGILEGLNRFGGQQQQLEQQKINQAISDYATTQQYPMLQLGLMSNMLRGLPMQAQTTQLYQAQPSVLQQGIGALGAAGSLYGAGAFGRKEGGTVKMAEGGIAGYKYGGAIAEPKLESMADSLSVQQLQQRIKDPALTPGERQVFQEALAAKQQTMARSQGIAAAGGGLFNTMGYAGGGILAFAGEDGSLIEDPQFGGSSTPMVEKVENPRMSVDELFKKYPGLEGKVGLSQIQDYTSGRSVPPESAKAPAPAPTVAAPKPEIKLPPAAPSTGSQAARAPSAQAGEASDISSILAGLRKEGPQGELGSSYLEKLKALESGADKRMDKAGSLAAARAFAKFGSTAAPGGIGQAALMGLGDYAEGYGKAVESDEKFRMENAKLQADIENLRRAEERGDVKLASDIQSKIKDRQLKIAEMQNQLKIAGMQASRPGEIEKAFALFEKNPAKFREFVAAKDTNRGNLATATTSILGAMYPQYKILSMIPEEKRTPEQNAALQRMYKEATTEAERMLRGGSASTTGGPAGGGGNLVQNKDGSFNYVPR